jgi:predicted RNase H-like HicB family nuclease
MNQHGWKPEWRDELDVILADASTYKDVPTRRSKVLAGLVKARKEHKEANPKAPSWVDLVYAEFRDEGADRLLKWYDNRTKSFAFVDYSGKVLNKPTVVGKTKKTEAGREYQREMILILTWDDLRDKRKVYLSQAKAAMDSVAVVDRLLVLQTECPEAKTPQDALDQLGISLEDWLESAR